jgi:hypothetical protein
MMRTDIENDDARCNTADRKATTSLLTWMLVALGGCKNQTNNSFTEYHFLTVNMTCPSFAELF